MATQQAAQEASQALIQRSHKTLAVTRDELCEMKDKLRERRQLLWQAKSMETVRQTRIILELSQIFPVLPVRLTPACTFVLSTSKWRFAMLMSLVLALPVSLTPAPCAVCGCASAAEHGSAECAVGPRAHVEHLPLRASLGRRF